MRIAANIAPADAVQVTLAADRIIDAARAEMDRLGMTATTAPAVTTAIDTLELAAATAGQLVAQRSGQVS